MKKVLKIVGIIVLSIIVIIVAAIGCFLFQQSRLANFAKSIDTKSPEVVEKEIKHINVNAILYVPVDYNGHVFFDTLTVASVAAAKANDPKIIDILVENGANISIYDGKYTGMSPIESAVSFNENPEIFKAFLKYMPEEYDENKFLAFSTCNQAIIFNKNPKVLEEVLKQDIIRRNLTGKLIVPLFAYGLAGRHATPEKAKILLDSGLDFYTKDDKGRTASDMINEKADLNLSPEIQKLVNEYNKKHKHK